MLKYDEFDEAVHKIVAMAMWQTANGLCEESRLFMEGEVGKRCVAQIQTALFEKAAEVCDRLALTLKHGDVATFCAGQIRGLATLVKAEGSNRGSHSSNMH